MFRLQFTESRHAPIAPWQWFKTWWHTWLLSFGLLGLAACSIPFNRTPIPPVGSCTLPLAAASSDEEAIRAILLAEGDLMVKQEITPLMALWSDGSFVANAKNTPQDTTDDQFWLDKDAIRHRYVRTVFPGAPSQAAPADLTIQITGTQATVIATTNIGDEISPAGDRWTLIKQGNCWLIESLTYNLEAAQP